MAAAALPAAGVAADAAVAVAEKTAHAIADALKQPVFHVEWERDPKHYKKLRVKRVEANITVGLIAIGVGGALVWEMVDAVASNLPGGGGGMSLIALVDPLAYAEINLLQTGWGGLMKLLGQSPPNSTVKVPKTFGAALNATLRDITVAGPGSLAQVLVGLASKLSPP
jgi:hypothetical protein